MQPGLPQQGYGGPQGYGDGPPAVARTNGGAAAIAGLLGLLTAGALVWYVIEMVSANSDFDQWPTEIMVSVIARAVLALLLLVAAAVTFARKVGGAWLLAVLGLITAACVVLEPVVASEFDGWFDALFAFEANWLTAIAIASILGLLTAIVAAIAGSTRASTADTGF